MTEDAALKNLRILIPLLEQSLCDAKMARDSKGRFDGERSAVVSLYRRSLLSLRFAQDHDIADRVIAN